MLDLKIDKSIEDITGWRSKGFFEWEILPLHGTPIHSIRHIWRKKTIKFNNNPLVTTTKFVNAYIVHDLDN